MVLIFDYTYKEDILDGIKEWTIRRGDRRKMIKIGSIHKCKEKLFSKDYFARVKILDIIVKLFKELTEQDAKDDLFDSLEECKERLKEIYGDGIENDVVSKIKFEIYGDE